MYLNERYCCRVNSESNERGRKTERGDADSARMPTPHQPTDAGTTSSDGTVLIIRIRPVFGNTIRPNTNTLFGLLFGPNRIFGTVLISLNLQGRPKMTQLAFVRTSSNLRQIS